MEFLMYFTYQKIYVFAVKIREGVSASGLLSKPKLLI
jgi:hypothetical protein